jgi:hypothetical protein
MKKYPRKKKEKRRLEGKRNPKQVQEMGMDMYIVAQLCHVYPLWHNVILQGVKM